MISLSLEGHEGGILVDMGYLLVPSARAIREMSVGTHLAGNTTVLAS
jgi:hypothetical protein